MMLECRNYGQFKRALNSNYKVFGLDRRYFSSREISQAEVEANAQGKSITILIK